MSPLDCEFWMAWTMPTPPSEDEIFSAWLNFDGGATLDEFREAYCEYRRHYPYDYYRNQIVPPSA